MALTISSLLVVLIATVFLVQNQSYGLQMQRSGAHDAARSVTEMLAAEIRTATSGSVVVAERDSLVIRTPMAMAVVCATSGNFAYVQFEGGEEGLDEDEVGGLGVRDPATGAWSYYSLTWKDIDGGTAQAATSCFANGADTVGARAEFHRLRRLATYHGSVPSAGTVLQLSRRTTYTIRGSGLDPSTLAFYRGATGETPVEFATGLSGGSGFQYRRSGSSSYEDRVSGAQLSDIDAVRVVAEMRRRVAAGGVPDVEFGWAVNVPLRNVR